MQYIIDSKTLFQMDEHWKPIRFYCSMCYLNYDYVIKFENLNIESQTFLEESKLKEFVSDDVWEKHLNMNRPKGMTR